MIGIPAFHPGGGYLLEPQRRLLPHRAGLLYNSNNLIHCDWNNARSTSGFGSVPRLNHGNTHSDPLAVEQICRWIDAEFGGPPKATATLSGLIVAAVAAIDGEESISG